MNKLHRQVAAMLVMAIALLPAGGCALINEDLDPCTVEYKVGFVFERNMLYVDAFHTQVRSVSLFAFDSDGNLAWQGHESGDALATPGYTMTLPLEPGIYDLIAWCGLNEGDAFTLAASQPRTKDDLACSIRKLTDSRGDYVEGNLNDLYHGQLDAVSIERGDGNISRQVNISLTKNTNRIHVLLHNIDGSTMGEDDFTVTVEAANGLMHHDNSILPDDGFEYRHYRKRAATVGAPTGNGRPGETITTYSTHISDIAVARLMADRHPRLVVTRNADGTRIVDLPLTDYLLMVKDDDARRPMTPQEYLDRQDEFTINFFLTGDNSWDRTMAIYINSWTVVPPQDTQI